MQTPSIGRIVHYMLTSNQAVKVNELRHVSEMTLGQPLKYGNRVNAGDVCPMIITHVDQFSSGAFTVNGQVFLDGNDSLWASHALEGVGPGFWQWPPRTSMRDIEERATLAVKRATDHILSEKELAERPDRHLEDDKRMERDDE